MHNIINTLLKYLVFRGGNHEPIIYTVAITEIPAYSLGQPGAGIVHIDCRILVNDVDEGHQRIVLDIEIDSTHLIQDAIAPQVRFISTGLQTMEGIENILIEIILNEGRAVLIRVEIVVEFRIGL